MEKNDEMTSGQIEKKLERYGISVCSSTVRRMRKKLWLDSAEDSILSAHPSSEQSETTGVRSACVGKWRHF